MSTHDDLYRDPDEVLELLRNVPRHHAVVDALLWVTLFIALPWLIVIAAGLAAFFLFAITVGTL